MKANPAIPFLLAAVAVLALPATAFSQVPAPSPQAPASESQQPKPDQKKAHRVWTNDDLGSSGSSADAHAVPATPAAASPSAKASAAGAQSDSAAPPPGGPPALADPKNIDQADKMLAWEDRDIAAQEETVAKLQKELDDAPPDRKEALQRALQQRQRILAETRQEKKALAEKKEALQKQ